MMITIKRILICSLLIILASCATIVNRKTYKLEVTSTPQNIKIDYNDSIYTTPCKIKVRRDNKDLKIVAINDTLTKKYTLKKHLSPSFLYGNLGFMQMCPAGYLIDLTNKKKYSYGRHIQINMFDTIKTINNSSLLKIADFAKTIPDKFPYTKSKQGLIFIKLSIPEGNFFYIKNKNNYTNYFGFLGLSTELGYFYSQNKYISIGAGALTTFIIPVPAPFDYDGVYESASGLYADINHGHQFGRFSISYGLNISKNIYNHNYNTFDPDSAKIWYKDIDTSRYSIKENRFGLSLTAKMKLTDKLQIGVKYLPSLCNFGELDRIKYTHIVFLDFIINFDILTNGFKIHK